MDGQVAGDGMEAEDHFAGEAFGEDARDVQEDIAGRAWQTLAGTASKHAAFVWEETGGECGIEDVGRQEIFSGGGEGRGGDWGGRDRRGLGGDEGGGDLAGTGCATGSDGYAVIHRDTFEPDPGTAVEPSGIGPWRVGAGVGEKSEAAGALGDNLAGAEDEVLARGVAARRERRGTEVDGEIGDRLFAGRAGIDLGGEGREEEREAKEEKSVLWRHVTGRPGYLGVRELRVDGGH